MPEAVTVKENAATVVTEPDRIAHRARDLAPGAANPFEMMRFRVRASDGQVVSLTDRNPQSRAFFLGYQYTFGRPPKVRQVAPEASGGIVVSGDSSVGLHGRRASGASWAVARWPSVSIRASACDVPALPGCPCA